jgi:hypothetical protein
MLVKQFNQFHVKYAGLLKLKADFVSINNSDLGKCSNKSKIGSETLKSHSADSAQQRAGGSLTEDMFDEFHDWVVAAHLSGD